MTDSRSIHVWSVIFLAMSVGYVTIQGFIKVYIGFMHFFLFILYLMGLPWWLSGKESACNVGDTGLIPGSGRCPGGGNGNPLQYSCLGNPVDRGAWQAIVHGVAEDSDMT